MTDIDKVELLKVASKQLDYAYVPYSNFRVGAALLTEDGSVFGGSNIENIAFSPTNCAERSAIFAAVSSGHRKFKALLITGNTEDTIKPCGVCRQVMNEFFDKDTQIFLTNQSGKIEQTTMEELLPGSFSKLK
ncbi:MAG: cytidine deaminase [Lactobacillaceae bacterium]|jgi:cytidine deaminase|nr:cytidine deaminase [Lactobacillaceae bacterium]